MMGPTISGRLRVSQGCWFYWYGSWLLGGTHPYISWRIFNIQFKLILVQFEIIRNVYDNLFYMQGVTRWAVVELKINILFGEWGWKPMCLPCIHSKLTSGHLGQDHQALTLVRSPGSSKHTQSWSKMFVANALI